MKISKEELKQKINALDIDDERKIELLEDVEDSMDVTEDNGESTELTELKLKYEDLKEKYKARFLDGESTEEEPKDESAEEPEEVEEIDITEI